MKKVMLDVDTGVDDALAILYGLESGELDVQGITTVCGNVPLEMVVSNTKRVLTHMGRTDIPVVPGAQRPLLREAEHEYKVHGADGIGGAIPDVQAEGVWPYDDRFAPDFIIEQASRHRGELTLILVGPLTNFALALRREPRVAEWLKEVVIMGGLVSEAGRGNKLPNAEFNIYADAEAALIVFHSGADITLVSLDVTLQTYLTMEHIEQLEGTAYYNFVRESTGVFREFSRDLFGTDGCALHDPLTVGYVLDPTLLQTERHYVTVETVSPLSYGQTICDFRGLWKEAPNVRVCLGVEADRFLAHFIETLRGKA
ncbi:nucleoside hydrolase [Alkalicoccus chagannorensis]|uniref:nucleoside hydrolase n=1 Tax=Alkalicoccus chagannorensis TaxID=427072 RepID=UPI000412E9BA|nr:nucleoside hydrolase [Alkalicoccus chagannorensis]